MQLLYRGKPCPLCGEVHPLEILSYPSRSYREPESREDVWILIVLIICRQAKALGRQYTKRLLPDFLIPYARMRLDKVVEAVQEVALYLAEREAAAVHLHPATSQLRPLTPLERAEELLERQDEAHLRAGDDIRHTPALRPLLQAVLWKKRRKVLTSYASRPPPDP